MRLRHLDFSRMLYHVTESYKTEVFRKPKGAKSRFVYVPDFLAEEFKAHVTDLRRQCFKRGVSAPVDLLVVDPERIHNASPFSQREIQAALKRAYKAAGLAVRNPHDPCGIPTPPSFSWRGQAQPTFRSSLATARFR